MQRAGEPSWRLSLSTSSFLDAALHVRAATGVSPPDDPSNPPPLIRAVERADPTAPVSDQLGSEWLAWWRELVALAGARQLRDGSSRAWAQDQLRRWNTVFDPPDFAALADRPELRRAVQSVLPTAAVRSEPEPRILWEDSKQVADELITQRGVRPDELDAAIVFLPVTGLWTFTARPGSLLASVGWADDSERARLLMRAAFESAFDA